jgi:hypothetical protein
MTPWRFYERMTLVGGEAVRGDVLGRSTLGCFGGACDLGEAMSLPLSKTNVAAAVDGGLRVRFNGRYGTFAADIAVDYFGRMRQAGAPVR